MAIQSLYFMYLVISNFVPANQINILISILGNEIDGQIIYTQPLTIILHSYSKQLPVQVVIIE